MRLIRQLERKIKNYPNGAFKRTFVRISSAESANSTAKKKKDLDCHIFFVNEVGSDLKEKNAEKRGQIMPPRNKKFKLLSVITQPRAN